MSEALKIAGVQMDVTLGDTTSNLERITQAFEATAATGARLTVFPECAATGYCFDSLDEARVYGESIPGPSTERIGRVCAQLGVFAVFGLLESEGERLFNACVLTGPAGLVGSYRKIHLPFLGVDRFTTPGDRPFTVHSADNVRVGMNICYDSAFPESARVMALAGADLIVLPTNFPPGGDCMADYVINARAMENRVYYACVNRVGTERGFEFIGKSKICDPNGKTVAEAAHTDEAILYAEVDPEQARQKRIVRVPDKHIIDRFADRRPEMYGKVSET